MELKVKRLLAVSLIITLLITILPFKSIQAETVYLGGSQTIGSSNTGSSGSHSIVVPPGFPMALRVSIQVQKPGDFATQGYENSYPISQYSLVLVPPGTPAVAKTQSVLASKGGGVCEHVSNHPGVVLEDDGSAKGAIWSLFVGGTGIYNGDAKSLIGEGKTYAYNSSLESSVFIPALAATKSGASVITNAGGQMYVSTKDIDEDDTQKQAQMALTGLALDSALKELGHPDIDLADMAKYFMNEGSSREYIVIIENMLACKDTANAGIGYWWTLSNTAISEISGHDVISEEYNCTTGEYLKNVCINKINFRNGDDKVGYQAASGNMTQQYLFNYWFTPTYNGYWVTDVAVSTLWYQRSEKKDDETNELIWGAQYEGTNPNNLDTGKFGFNVLTCFVPPVTPVEMLEGGDGVHQLYSDPEVINAERGVEVETIQSADFQQYDEQIIEDITNTVINGYVAAINEKVPAIRAKHEESTGPLPPDDDWEEKIILYFSRIDYDITFQGDVDEQDYTTRVGPGKFKLGVEGVGDEPDDSYTSFRYKTTLPNGHEIDQPMEVYSVRVTKS